MKPLRATYRSSIARVRAWAAYWRYEVWFYLWKWSMPVASLHRRTIRPVNAARQAYLTAFHARRPP